MTNQGIAIIGMACQFPGADGVDAFWEQLVDGRDALSVVPSDRWEAQLFERGAVSGIGQTYSPSVGMEASADRYDAPFFQIDPHEAERMDPQQGKVLELAWHACEDAGIVPDALVGRDVGVYIGVSTRDFDRRMASLFEHVDVRTSTGASGAIIPNRLSYVFGLTGPSVAVDTACASSLASIHLACRALEDEECELAFAGGVQLILSPANMIAFTRSKHLASDGRCKPFSSEADGYVCGEGAGLLLLKPLRSALRDGDPVRAVIRGSAINHNGRSNGLSAPYRAGQKSVIRKALDRAAVAPHSVDYVEAHAVGTHIGDAIEFQAIRDMYGNGRPQERPCYVGSVKSNIGHLEAAAGVASLIKSALAVEHGVLPPSLHCDNPSTLLRIEQGSLELCSTKVAWPHTQGPRRAAVSAFGFGGSNAHIILEQAPIEPGARGGDRSAIEGPRILAVSARSELAFAHLSAAYVRQLQALGDSPELFAAFCDATLSKRQRHPVRRATVASNAGEAIRALADATPAVRRPSLRVRIGACAEKTQVLFAMLNRLGCKRVWSDSISADQASALAALAGRSDVTVVPYDAERSYAVDGRIILTCDDGAECDVAWEDLCEHPAPGLFLAVEIFECGFATELQRCASTAPIPHMRLPSYPFERRRHYVIPDVLAVPSSDGAAFTPLTLAKVLS